VCAEGARIERAPGPSVPDHGVATRCLSNSASPPRSCVPPAGVEPACPCGRAGLSRVRLPFRHGGRAARRGFESRSPDSESGVHADLDQRASITWLPLAAGVGCPRVERGVFRSRSGWVGRLPRIRGADGRRVFLQHPREDSNLDLDVRSVALCPLSYGGQLLLVPGAPARARVVGGGLEPPQPRGVRFTAGWAPTTAQPHHGCSGGGRVHGLARRRDRPRRCASGKLAMTAPVVRAGDAARTGASGERVVSLLRCGVVNQRASTENGHAASAEGVETSRSRFWRPRRFRSSPTRVRIYIIGRTK
jgi:hypothetical protein